jgi:hypothetical protein
MSGASEVNSGDESKPLTRLIVPKLNSNSKAKIEDDPSSLDSVIR